jgi:hypothetical protein
MNFDGRLESANLLDRNIDEILKLGPLAFKKPLIWEQAFGIQVFSIEYLKFFLRYLDAWYAWQESQTGLANEQVNGVYP